MSAVDVAQDKVSPALKPAPSLAELTAAFFQIGVLSFGGATAQIAMLHTLAVEERRWIDEQRYLRALNLCMLLPGPEAQQLATYMGWHLRGVTGGIIAGALFVIPGAVLMLLLSLLFVMGGGLSWVDGLFFGLKAAVLAIVAQAIIKLSKRALKTPAFIALAVAAFGAFAFVNIPFPIVIVVAAAIGIALTLQAQPSAPAQAAPLTQDTGALWGTSLRATVGGLAAWWLPVGLTALVVGSSHVIIDVALFFSKIAVLSFGGAYALLAWLADAAVSREWVTTREMIAGLGLAETTPGPTILVTQFVGFIAGWKNPGALSPVTSAVLAALLTTWVTFAPSFLWIFAGAPWLDFLLRNRLIAGALQGITAAVVGAIAWLAVWFALNTVFRKASFADLGWFRIPSVNVADLDLAALILAVAALLMTFVAKQSMLRVLLAMALAGIAWRLAAVA